MNRTSNHPSASSSFYLCYYSPFLFDYILGCFFASKDRNI